MKNFNKAVSASLALVLTAGAIMPKVSAASDKEEVIYVMTDVNGSVDGVYAVNIWNGGNIVDYGDYDDIMLMNSADSVTVDGDKISFSTDNDKVYCEGVMTNAKLPWNISLAYTLDGKELPAEELAGQSGHLQIRFKITENTGCKGDFFDSYALQANFVLDTKLCENITANGATTANVGSKKQLNYTIFPGKGIDTVIEADVHDFEMSSVDINGIKLNMDIDVDTSELSDKVTELNDGIGKSDDGAASLSSGSSELKDGNKKLKDGSSQLSSGAENLDSGISDLKNGITKVQNGLNTLNSKSESLTGGSAEVKSALGKIQTALSAVNSDAETLKKLVSASSQIKNAVSDLKKGADTLYKSVGYGQYKELMLQNGLDVDTLKSSNEQTITALTEQIAQLNQTLSQIDGVPGYEEQAALLQEQVSQLSDVITLLTANNGAIGGTEQYLTGLSDSIKKLYDGLSELEKSYTEFDSAVGTLADSLETMLVNASALSAAIDALTAEYDSLDSGIVSYTSAVSDICAGYSGIVGGVSKLASGSKDLLDGANSLDSGISDMYDGISELCDGAEKLSGGTGELRDKTSDMDTEIENKIDDMIESVKGGDRETVSFVSDKNGEVKSVQFVIKTEAIEIPEQQVEEEQTVENLTFWQKLLKLFGLY
ncbi:MAG: hypothetical protein NC320_11245 [Clostridium sp.]|nr:hypothetical protein [Clostridium sp.]